MTKIVVEQYCGDVQIAYPECPYAFGNRKNQLERRPDLTRCNHPELPADDNFCANMNVVERGDHWDKGNLPPKCPFDPRKERLGSVES